MPESQETAFVLPEDQAPTTEQQVLGQFPGRYVPGQPVALRELPFADEDEATSAVEDAGLPLERTEVPAGEGAMLPDQTRAPNQEEAAAAASVDEQSALDQRVGELTRAKTRDELNALAADQGVDSPEELSSKHDVAVAIAEAQLADEDAAPAVEVEPAAPDTVEGGAV